MEETTTVNENVTPKPGTKDALKAENEAQAAEILRLKAELEAKGTAENEAQAPVENREDIFVPKGYANDEPYLIVSVNGVIYKLPKGKTSNVPKHIADEIRRSQKAQEAMDKRIDEMLAASK